MQNLTLPTSQALALGTMDGFKNGVNVDKASSTAPNASFEMMLSKQVKAHKEAIHHKPVQHKPAQHQTEQDKQKNDNLTNTSASIAQMVGDAKTLLATDDVNDNLMLSAQAEEEAVNHSLINAENPTFSPEVLALALAPSMLPVTNKVAAYNANKNQLLNNDSSTAINRDMILARALSEFNNTQIKTSQLDQINNKSSNLPATTQSDASDIDSQQDRLLWASVSTAKSNQNSELVDGNALVSLAKDALTKTVETSKFSDIVNNLAIPANQQNQASQPNSMLTTHQLGNSNQINAYPGKAGWDQAISQKVVWMVGAVEQTATLTLNPPDLGPLQVVINVRNDMADTTFISDNAEVRQALQDGMANLREKMAESGIQLGQTNVNSGGRSQQEFQQAVLNRTLSKLSEPDLNIPVEKTTPKGTLNLMSNGLVDTFA